MGSCGSVSSKEVKRGSRIGEDVVAISMLLRCKSRITQKLCQTCGHVGKRCYCPVH